MLQNKNFTKGINSDIADEYLPEGMDRSRLNVRVLATNEGNDLCIEAILGNTRVKYNLPNGANEVIGQYEWKEGRKNYAFVYNEYPRDTPNQHQIYEYDQITNTISPVLIDNIQGESDKVLRFRKENLITGISIYIEGGDVLLGWTDNYKNPLDENDYNEPKMINVTKAKLYMQGDYINGYKDVSWQEFRLYLTHIKQPPQAPSYEWAEEDFPHLKTQVNAFLEQLNIDSGYQITEGETLIPFTAAYPNEGAQWDDILSQDVIQSDGYYRIFMHYWIKNINEGELGREMRFIVRVNGVSVYDYHFDAPNVVGGIRLFAEAIDPIHLFVNDVVQFFVVSNSFSPPPLYNYIIMNTNGGDRSFIEIDFRANDIAPPKNPLFKKLCYFKLQNVHLNNEISSLSPQSTCVFPVTALGINSTGEDYSYQSRKIIVHIPTGVASVRKLRLYVKIVGAMTTGDTPTEIGYCLVTELDKDKLGIPDNSTYDFNFFNDGNYTPIDTQMGELLFSNVPLYARAEESIKSDRAVLANYTEGFQPIQTDWRVKVEYELVDAPTNYYWVKRSYLKSAGIYQFGEINYDETGLRSGVTWVVDAKTTELQQDGRYGTRLYLPFLTEDAWADGYREPPYEGLQHCPKVTINIYNRPNGNAKWYQIARSHNQAINYWIQFNAERCRYVKLDGKVTITPSEASFVDVHIGNIVGRYKEENPQSNLVYDYVKGDRLRFIGIATNYSGNYSSSISLYSYNEQEIISSWTDSDGQVVRVLINANTPLSFDTSDHITNALYEIFRPAKNVGADSQIMYETSEVGEIGADRYGNLIHKGDTKDQLISPATGVDIVSPSIYACDVPDVSELFVGDNVKLITPSGSVFGVITEILGLSVLFDITGETISGTLGSKGELIRAADHLLKGGDCFRRFTDMPIQFNSISDAVYRLEMYTECMNASNMFVSNAYDYGRPNVVDYRARRQTLKASARFSQSLIENTYINGLNIFYPLDFQDYPVQFGAINKLFYHDGYMDAYQDIKVLSIPILQSTISDNQGQIIIGKSTTVLGDQTLAKGYIGEFGIGENPEGFAFYGHARYFPDVKHSGILRLSEDGLTEITEVGGMSVFWAKICAKILSSKTKVNVYGTFDARFGEYIISVPKFDDFEGCTLAWNEKANQFSTFYSYLPEFMGTSGQDIITFKYGQLYTHNDGAIGEFYGDITEPEIVSVINAFPNNQKIFQSLEQNSDAAWVCVSAKTKGQETRMAYASNWVKKEKMWYSELKRDINTPNITNPIISGDQMRGTTMMVQLRYIGNAPSVMKSYNCYFINSPRHNEVSE